MRFLISLVGVIFLWRKIRNFLLYIINLVKGPHRDLTAIYGENSYVLITGGSDGIGKALSCEFAKKGFNLILVARDLKKLNNAKAEIQKQYPKTVIEVISFDFSEIIEPENIDIIKALGLRNVKIDISIVVNNVGKNTGDFFENLTEETIKEVIAVNCASQIVLANQFAKYFKTRQLKSAFVQTGSFASIKPFPFYDLYGATKTFNLFLSENIGAFDDKIDFYTFMPSYVSTKLNNYRSGLMVVSPEEAAQGAMINIGSSRRVFCGHWKHEVLGAVMTLLPECILGCSFIREKLYKIKKRGYQKTE